MKYEVKIKDEQEQTYGVWNNDMCMFQYIYNWDGTATKSLEDANQIAEKLNNQNMLSRLHGK